MRFLIVTQKIDEDDAVLGFMHGWLAEFSRQAESVVALCLEKGRVNLPANVKVFSLGKETGRSRLKYLRHFLRYIVRFRGEYDAVFVHMNPEYVALGGIFWKFWGKTVTLWYAHKSVPWHLRLAYFFTDIVFTSTASGFRLPGQKVKVIGQGIDTEQFKSQKPKAKSEDEAFRIITVGRMAPSKDYDTLIGAVEAASPNFSGEFAVDIFGPTTFASDDIYLNRLKEKIFHKGLARIINFRGPVANKRLPEKLGNYDLFVNMGQTGSLDKAVPEAMSCSLPVLTCNEAFKEVLGPFTGDLMYQKGDFRALAAKILKVAEMTEEKRRALGEALRAIVVRDHSLQSFVGKIVRAVAEFQQKKNRHPR